MREKFNYPTIMDMFEFKADEVLLDDASRLSFEGDMTFDKAPWAEDYLPSEATRMNLITRSSTSASNGNLWFLYSAGSSVSNTTESTSHSSRQMAHRFSIVKSVNMARCRVCKKRFGLMPVFTKYYECDGNICG